MRALFMTMISAEDTTCLYLDSLH